MFVLTLLQSSSELYGHFRQRTNKDFKVVWNSTDIFVKEQILDHTMWLYDLSFWYSSAPVLFHTHPFWYVLDKADTYKALLYLKTTFVKDNVENFDFTYWKMKPCLLMLKYIKNSGKILWTAYRGQCIGLPTYTCILLKQIASEKIHKRVDGVQVKNNFKLGLSSFFSVFVVNEILNTRKRYANCFREHWMCNSRYCVDGMSSNAPILCPISIVIQLDLT